MKKGVIFLLVLAGAVCGARSEQLLTQGKSWVFEQDYRELVDYWVWGMSTTRRVNLEVTGDTIVADKPCKVIVQTINGESEKLIGYEEGGIVYQVIIFKKLTGGAYKTYSVFIPLIDFNARKGDVLQCYIYKERYESYEPRGTLTVTDEETVTAYGTERRVITLSNGAQWVDGVGASIGENHLLTQYCPLMLTYGTERMGVIDRDEMIECRQDGNLIWTASDFTSINEIESDSASGSALYDLQGRKVAAPAPGRLYIKDGKKTVF